MKLFQLTKALLALICIFQLSAIQAQDDYVTNKKDPNSTDMLFCRRFFIGPTFGINNNAGLLGVNFEYGVTEKVSLGAGFGLGMWGGKAFFEGKYYFNECYKKSALGIAVTRCSGIPELTFEEELPSGGKHDVVLDALPQTNIALQYYHHFKMGKHHRFHISAGYSFETSSQKYRVVGPNQPSRELRNYMHFVAPGGVIFGLGFTFGA